MKPDDWWPIGTAVRVWPGTKPGRTVDTTTRSLPWMLGGHTPVVQVEGIAGAIHTQHVEVLA